MTFGRYTQALAFFFGGIICGMAVIGPTHAAFAAPTMQSGATASMGSVDMQFMKAMQLMNNDMRKAKLTGNPDRDFMTLMIPHHQAAINMALVELKYGKSAKVKSLANNIIRAQRSEITQMETWLQAAY